MHLKTALVWLVVVLALGAVALWQLRRETAEPPSGPRAVVVGLEPDAIAALRVDSLERGLQLRLERDATHGWLITDPLAFPASDALVKQLVDVLTLHPAEHWSGEAAALGLRPPRAVVELQQATDTGTRTRRVELGALDVDNQHVFLAVDGELVRATRSLESLLALPLPEWRERSILPELSPRGVVELTRRGRAQVPGFGEVDLDLDALREERWRTSAPFVAALGPEAFGTLLSSLCALRADGFETDAPGPLEDYGLEPPDFRIEVRSLRGESIALRFAQVPGRERMLCQREGTPNIFAIGPEQMTWLTAPAEVLVDRELARFQRERVTHVRLVASGHETLIERQGFGWLVSASGGAGAELARQKADSERVSDLLARIERARVLEVLPGVEFDAGPLAQALYVEVDGERLGGELGVLHASHRGTQGLLFRRVGDSLCGLVEPELLELASTDPLTLRSDELHRVAELEVAQVKLVAAWAQARRTWGRDERGRWIPEGSTAEARDFARLVDRLLTVRATELLEPDEEPVVIQPLAVAVLDRGGTPKVAFALLLVAQTGDDPETAQVLYQSQERRALVDPALYFELRELLDLP